MRARRSSISICTCSVGGPWAGRRADSGRAGVAHRIGCAAVSAKREVGAGSKPLAAAGGGHDDRPGIGRIVHALAIAALVAGALGSCSLRRPAGSSFDTQWHDGRAELDGYRLTVTRYGHVRPARAVAIYVTEPFSASRRVKLDEPVADPADVVDVLKLNPVRAVQAGVHGHHTDL